MEGDIFTKTPFIILLHAHDHVWRSDYSLEVRKEACRILWNLAIFINV